MQVGSPQVDQPRLGIRHKGTEQEKEGVEVATGVRVQDRGDVTL